MPREIIPRRSRGDSVYNLRFFRESTPPLSERMQDWEISTVKTPTRSKSSLAVSDSSKTDPTSQSAIQAIEPYYGPRLQMPTPPKQASNQTALQRQYAKIFFDDTLDDLTDLSTSLFNHGKKEFRQIAGTECFDFCQFRPRPIEEPWCSRIFGLYETTYQPGARQKDLRDVISQCIQCKSMMVRTYMDRHKCPSTEKEIALTLPSTVEAFLQGLQPENLDSNLLGISPAAFRSLFLQCSGCLAVVAKASTEWHTCQWDDEFDVAEGVSA